MSEGKSNKKRKIEDPYEAWKAEFLEDAERMGLTEEQQNDENWLRQEYQAFLADDGGIPSESQEESEESEESENDDIEELEGMFKEQDDQDNDAQIMEAWYIDHSHDFVKELMSTKSPPAYTLNSKEKRVIIS